MERLNFYQKRDLLFKKERENEISMNHVREVYSTVNSLHMTKILRKVILAKSKKSVFSAVKEIILEREILGNKLNEKTKKLMLLFDKNKFESITHLDSTIQKKWKLTSEEKYVLESFEKDKLVPIRSDDCCFRAYRFYFSSQDAFYYRRKIGLCLNNNSFERKFLFVGDEYKDRKNGILTYCELGSFSKSYKLKDSSEKGEDSEDSSIEGNSIYEDISDYFKSHSTNQIEACYLMDSKYYKECAEYMIASKNFQKFSYDISRFLNSLFDILKLDPDLKYSNAFLPTKMTLGNDYFYFFSKEVQKMMSGYTEYLYDVALEVEKEIVLKC